MQTKLHINVSQGILEVEGDAALVREIYADFKGKFVGRTESQFSPADPLNAPKSEGGKVKTKRKSTSRKRGGMDDSAVTINADHPKMDKDLDTSGIVKFYEQFEPANNAEKILIFLKFLSEMRGIDAPNTDQIYTCYEATNQRIPKVFAQAFRDASGRKFGYINYNGPTDITVTTMGNNHFKLDLKRKTAE